MIEALIILALIPFALWGLVILAGIAWVIAPYVLALIFGSVAVIMFNISNLEQWAFVPATACALAIGWVFRRWSS